MEEKKMNLYEKLAAIRKLSQSVVKNRAGYGYRYASLDEILVKITLGFDRYGVSLIPEMVSEGADVEMITIENQKFTKDGKQYTDVKHEYITRAPMKYTFVNNENPEERIGVPWFATGSQADPSQATSAALTYSLRAFLTNYFQIALLDETDPDSFYTRRKAAEEEENRITCSGIIESIDDLIRCHLEAHPDDKENIKEAVKQHIKVGGKASFNFKQCTDPAMLASLLDALTERYSDTAAE